MVEGRDLDRNKIMTYNRRVPNLASRRVLKRKHTTISLYKDPKKDLLFFACIHCILILILMLVCFIQQGESTQHSQTNSQSSPEYNEERATDFYDDNQKNSSYGSDDLPQEVLLIS